MSNLLMLPRIFDPPKLTWHPLVLTSKRVLSTTTVRSLAHRLPRSLALPLRPPATALRSTADISDGNHDTNLGFYNRANRSGGVNSSWTEEKDGGGDPDLGKESVQGLRHHFSYF